MTVIKKAEAQVQALANTGHMILATWQNDRRRLLRLVRLWQAITLASWALFSLYLIAKGC